MKLPPDAIGRHVRPPKQGRSQASFERVLEAAVDLFEKKGYDGFTLHEVVRQARVSIGSIYCRVKSKDDLIQAVQIRVGERLDPEVDQFTDPRQWDGVEVKVMVKYLIRELGEFLRRHAAIHRALIAC